MQTCLLERLLERISVSKYKDNFILKGGMLISAMLGINSRTTIIKRGVLGTRIRDYYDIHMLLNTQNKNINKETLRQAILITSNNRETIDMIKNWREILEILENDISMKRQWTRYQKNNFYAERY